MCGVRVDPRLRGCAAGTRAGARAGSRGRGGTPAGARAVGRLSGAVAGGKIALSAAEGGKAVPPHAPEHPPAPRVPRAVILCGSGWRWARFLGAEGGLHFRVSSVFHTRPSGLPLPV